MNKRIKRQTRHRRVRARIIGSSKRPRLCVFRSSKHIYAQLIDDSKAKILASAGDLNVKAKGKIETAGEIGRKIAGLAKELGLEEVVFDRGGYRYHGRVKALAEGAREKGLKF